MSVGVGMSVGGVTWNEGGGGNGSVGMGVGVSVSWHGSGMDIV